MRSYIEPLVSALFLTSVATHHISLRRSAAEERNRLIARASILENLVHRLRAGERIPQHEYARLVALAGRDGEPTMLENIVPPEKAEVTTWKETIFGNKAIPPSSAQGEDVDEETRREWEKAIQQSDETQRPIQDVDVPAVSPKKPSFPHDSEPLHFPSSSNFTAPITQKRPTYYL